MIDRLLYGGVVDYWHLLKIPVFNLADLAIVVSLVVLCVQEIIYLIKNTADN